MLESTRAAYESIERCECEVTRLLGEKSSGQSAKIFQLNEINNLLEHCVDKSREIEENYIDADGIWKEELQNCKGEGMFDSFYQRLAELQDYNERFPNVIADDSSLGVKAVNVQFSDEEVYGKYFDLHRFHHIFCNITNQSRLSYKEYLKCIDQFSQVSTLVKSRPSTDTNSTDIPQMILSKDHINVSRLSDLSHRLPYVSYLVELNDYLTGFLLRTQPLLDISPIADELAAVLNEEWKDESPSFIESFPSIAARLAPFSSLDELSASSDIPLDELKQILITIGMKCGGTRAERCSRLWFAKTMPRDGIDNNLFAAKSSSSSKAQPSSQPITLCSDDSKIIVQLERDIIFLIDFQSDVCKSSQRHVDKQASRGVEEKLAEIEEEECGNVFDDDEEEERKKKMSSAVEEKPLYNPLNLPIGWDGKPIPFWLFKLHGLGQEFKCEVCGNQSYYGRRSFDRHFLESRHAFGMKCLGIPNTNHFYELTRIEDVLSLYGLIRNQLITEQYTSNQMEEFEDGLGNVLDRKTYTDLAKQGLLY